MTSYFQLIVIHFWQKILAIKNPLDLILAPSKGGDVMCTYTRDQVTERARCEISNKGYLSLNIFVILCHNRYVSYVINNLDIIHRHLE